MNEDAMIEPDSYRTSFDVAADPDEAFRIASRPSLWWGEMIHGPSSGVGDRFEWNVPGVHFTAFEVTTFDEPNQIVWEVLDSGNDHEATEWIGTHVEFTFAPSENGTTVTFVHRGLTPWLDCFGACSRGWDHHLDVGLRAYLDGEAAEPLTLDTVDTVDAVAAKIGAGGVGT